MFVMSALIYYSSASVVILLLFVLRFFFLFAFLARGERGEIGKSSLLESESSLASSGLSDATSEWLWLSASFAAAFFSSLSASTAGAAALSFAAFFFFDFLRGETPAPPLSSSPSSSES